MNRRTFVNERMTLAVFEFSVFRMSAFGFKFPCPVKWRFHISPGSFSALILNFRMSAFQFSAFEFRFHREAQYLRFRLNPRRETNLKWQAFEKIWRRHFTSMCRMTGSRSAISHAPERLGDVKHSLASIGKLHAAGFAPGGNFNEGLQTTVEFFKQP